MNVGPSGFNNAPVTRALDISQKLQIWKLIISVFTFSSTPELVFGLYLLYYFCVFERQIGWNKYSVFLLFSFVISLLLEGNYPAPISSTPEPPEDSIVRLVSMGFDRNSARQALIHSKNDVNTATNILLESQSH